MQIYCDHFHYRQYGGILTMRRFLIIVCTAAIAAAFAVSPSQATSANGNAVPPVPTNIQVPAGYKLSRVAQATGTQNYICLPSGSGVNFALFTPQATLFEKRTQTMTHYFSPNPTEGGTIRATWLDSRDTSTVWGEVKPGNSSTDPAYVASGAIPWLLVTIVGSEDGNGKVGTLARTTFIQRLNTSGGMAPKTGCSSAADIGNKAFVPYTTDYYFYKSAR
jgi:hypothetical protein